MTRLRFLASVASIHVDPFALHALVMQILATRLYAEWEVRA